MNRVSYNRNIMTQDQWKSAVLSRFPLVTVAEHKSTSICYDLNGNVLGGLVWRERRTRHGGIELHIPVGYLHS